MDVSNIHVHDGRLLRVVEDAERDTLTMEVELPATPDSDELVPRLLVFADVYEYKVFEGPFSGCPVLLSMTSEGVRVRIDTNAGYRELCCSGIKVLERNSSRGDR